MLEYERTVGYTCMIVLYSQRFFLLGWLTFLLGYNQLSAQEITESFSLSQPEETLNYQWGRSCAISQDGKTILVSIDELGATVFSLTQANTWEYQILEPSGPLHFLDPVDVAISSDGTTVVLGARRSESLHGVTGTAYIFKRTEETWAEEAALVGSDIFDYAHFGNHVDISANGLAVVVSAKWHEVDGEPKGGIYVFTRSEDGVWSESDNIIELDQSTLNLGSSISLSEDGTTIVATSRSSSQVVFDDQFSTYNREVTSQFRKGVTIRFGFREYLKDIGISNDGSRIIVTEGYIRDSLHVFNRYGVDDGETISLIATVTENESGGFDGFGSSVVLPPGGDVAIAAVSSPSSTQRAAFLFADNGDGTWIQVGKLFPSYADPGDNYYSVDATDQWVVLCGPNWKPIPIFDISSITANVSASPIVPRHDLLVWPNPAHQKFEVSIQLEHPQVVSFSMHDLLGRSIMPDRKEFLIAGGNTVGLNPGNLPPGIYVLVVRGNSWRRSTRITVFGR